MEIDWTKPSITDWINSFTALIGVPLAIYGIIKLFLNDKEKERKLTSLEAIAIAQNKTINILSEQVQELARHTSEYQYHSELMKESNDLMRKMFELQDEMFSHNRVNDGKREQLQRMERLINIKPYFTFLRGISNPETLTIKLTNKGQIANNLIIERIGTDFVNFIPFNKDLRVEQNQILEIKGYVDPNKTYFNGNQVPYEVVIYFSDVDGNNYKQVLSKSNGIRISLPELIEDKN